MLRLLDPTSTMAVILGAYEWDKAGMVAAPAYRRSASQFHTYLVTQPPHGLGLQPDLILNLFNDPSPASVLLDRIRSTIRNFVREYRESQRVLRDLLIYYVGHGFVDSAMHLHLLIRDTGEGFEEQSSIRAPDLAQILRRAAPQQRRLVVLDCCFSEAAAAGFGGMGPLDETVASAVIKDLEREILPPERGTLLFCSSPRGAFSIGFPNADLTLFTGSLLGVLKEGSVSRPSEMLSFSDLRDDVYGRMLRYFDGDPPRPALHQPDQQAGDLTRLPAFPNVAWHQAQEERQAAEARRKAEEERQAAEARRKAEEERQAAEARRKAEEERQAAEARRKAEEERQAAEARRKAEEERQAAEARRKAEEERQAAEARRKAEEERQAPETLRKAEDKSQGPTLTPRMQTKSSYHSSRDTRESIDFRELAGGSTTDKLDFETAYYALEAAVLVRRMRERAALTQRALSDRLGVSLARVNKIELGDGPAGPTYALLRRIARACGVRLSVVIAHEESEHPS
jgi:DNA-binding XRE family transcriptional regulator